MQTWVSHTKRFLCYTYLFISCFFLLIPFQFLLVLMWNATAEP